MKPRTKFEQAVIAQSGHLRPLCAITAVGRSAILSTITPIVCPKVAQLVWTADIRG